jgi:hypothetical protein
MSHHFDYTADERLDISDAYCFAGCSDDFGPRTVFAMNASPSTGIPWDPAGYYDGTSSMAPPRSTSTPPSR